MESNRTLLSSIVKKVSPSTTDGVRFTTFNLSGERWAGAVVDAVADSWHRITGRYRRPTAAELSAAAGAGMHATVVRVAESIFGTASLVADTGRIFTVADGRVGLLPKGKRSKGLLLKEGTVLDVLPGGTLDEAQALCDRVRAQFPEVAEIVPDDFNALPEPRDENGPGTCPMAVLLSWPMPDGVVPGCVYLFDERFREDGILGGWLMVPPESGHAATSEHGSVYASQLSKMKAARVVGWKGCTAAEALAWCDDYAGLLRALKAAAPAPAGEVVA